MSPDEHQRSGLSAEEARRRRARIFGDVLPDETTDERDDGSPPADGPDRDQWLRNNVPPHHGD